MPSGSLASMTYKRTSLISITFFVSLHYYFFEILAAFKADSGSNSHSASSICASVSPPVLAFSSSSCFSTSHCNSYSMAYYIPFLASLLALIKSIFYDCAASSWASMALTRFSLSGKEFGMADSF